MDSTRSPLLSLAVLTVAAVLFGDSLGCGTQTVSTLYTVGGNVTGLNGTLKLANNSGDTLTLTASGAFKFATGLKNKAAYNVTVAVAPSGQTCTVSAGQGTVAAASVTNVAVTCSHAAYTLSGTVSGLTGNLELANGSATVSVASGATSFAFADALANGAPYDVTVKTQPAGQRCTVTGGSGTVSGASVAAISIACVATYTLKMHLTGVTGVNMQVSDNANDLLDVTHVDSVTTYDVTFPTGYAAGESYTTAVAVQPQDQDTGDQSNYCTVQSPNGTMATTGATVNVTCVQALRLYVSVTRPGGTVPTVELADGISPDIIFSDTSTAVFFDAPYPDTSAYRVHLVAGDGCIPCPTNTGGNAAAASPTGGGSQIDTVGSFQGSDITVIYACPNPNASTPAPAVCPS